MLKGHTDSTGDAEANLTLSEARAASVKQFLIDGGIDAARLGSAGYGSTQPIETNDTEEGLRRTVGPNFSLQRMSYHK
jgi:outer membrane protein OmpA-like peptidoglycan-associated protein